MDNTKATIRKEISTKLNNQAGREAFKKSKIIKEKLFATPEFKRSKCVMLYASIHGEVNTDEMIDEALEKGKKVTLPRCTSLEGIVPKEISKRNNDLEKGAYGIREPREDRKTADLKDIDLYVVPGIAFDKRNRRLGRGKGYYDKFLKKLPGNKITIGLAFDFQIVENLPQDSHDIPVSKVIAN